MDNLLNDRAKTEEEFDVDAYKSGLQEKYGQLTREEFANLVEQSPFRLQTDTLMQVWDDNKSFNFKISHYLEYDRLRLADEVSKQINLQASNIRATQEIAVITGLETKVQIEGLIDKFMLEFRANSELFNLSIDSFDLFTLHIMKFVIDDNQGLVGLWNSLREDNLIRPKASPTKVLQFATKIRINFRETAA